MKDTDELWCVIVRLGLGLGCELVGDTRIDVDMADGLVGVTEEIEEDECIIVDVGIDVAVGVKLIMLVELNDLKPRFIFGWGEGEKENDKECAHLGEFLGRKDAFFPGDPF